MEILLPNGNSSYLQFGINLVLVSQPQVSSSSLVDYSIDGNRLHKNENGDLEIISKSPAEIFGERILRPLIDIVFDWSNRSFQVLKSSSSFLDFNFLPSAQAAAFEYEDSYHKAEQLHQINVRLFDEEEKKMAKALEQCKKEYGEEVCLLRKNSSPPEIIYSKTNREGEEIHIKEPLIIPGHLFWSVQVKTRYRGYLKGFHFANGAYGDQKKIHALDFDHYQNRYTHLNLTQYRDRYLKKYLATYD